MAVYLRRSERRDWLSWRMIQRALHDGNADRIGARRGLCCAGAIIRAPLKSGCPDECHGSCHQLALHQRCRQVAAILAGCVFDDGSPAQRFSVACTPAEHCTHIILMFQCLPPPGQLCLYRLVAGVATMRAHGLVLLCWFVLPATQWLLVLLIGWRQETRYAGDRAGVSDEQTRADATNPYAPYQAHGICSLTRSLCLPEAIQVPEPWCSVQASRSR